MMPANEWERVLRESGVRLVTAEIMAPIFAATIREGTFSKGEAELPDFLSTILHESAYLEKLKESGKYSARRIRELAQASAPGSRWRSLGPRAEFLEFNEPAFFEACYGGRMGNGPEGSGDGARYPGRGFIGLTGRDNYGWLGDVVGQDLLGIPHLAEQPTFGLEFTIAWWEGKVPDRLLGDERAIRKVVNGGYFGVAEVEHLALVVGRALA
jgi:putative chitinase